LTLPQYPEELTYDNNEISCFVDVVKRKLKVLLIAGSPTMEFHHLVPSLIRDSVIDVSCFLQTADVNAVQQGNDVIDQLPRTTQEWNRYDVVVVYDIDPNKFTNDQETGLEWLVQNGGGVLFIAGRVNGMASLVQVRSAKIRAMLPVEINKNERPEHAQIFDQPFRIVRTPEGQKHPLLLFSMDTKQNDSVWQSFAELNFYWHHPAQGLSGKGIALMEKAREDQSSKRVPLMAMMRYGKGSSIYLGIHDIWRWRYPMESYDYDQFWSQTIRYLGEVRMLGSQRQVVLNTDKKMYSPGEQVEIRLSLLDPALVNQLRNDQIFAKVTDAEKGEYQVMLQPSVKDPTLRIGRYSARRIGVHEVRASHVLAEDLAAQKAVFDEKKHFTVRMQSLEYKDTTADLDGLRNVSDVTGGEALTHETITDLKNLPAKVSTEPDWQERETFGDLWDRLPVLLVLLFFGTVELYFRRRWALL
jgi:uncharacterized membrane protein